jgi:anthranilate phosphoribosyltransferase
MDPVAAGRDLTANQVDDLIPILLDSAVPDEPKADLLIALAQKGESTGELAAFASNFRQRSILPVLSKLLRDGEIVDVCGTGGDRLNTFNISTTVALVVASAEIPVAKHGNRAITSSTGSADVLDALGIATNLSPVEAAEWLEKFHFAFFFAPLYHPAFKNLSSVRKLCATRGHRSIFNLLGPLLNPARPTAQLIGVPGPSWCEKIARAAQSLGVRRAMVVSGKLNELPEANLDEI